MENYLAVALERFLSPLATPEDGLNTLYGQLKQLNTVEGMMNQAMGDIFHTKMRTATADETPQGVEHLHYVPRMNPLRSMERETNLTMNTLINHRRDLILKYINIASRPFIRSLNILDMPDEILVHIFEYVKGWKPYINGLDDCNIGSTDIKNLRLTCRRFCEASSHLLMRFLRVEMSEASLEHFDEVSRHPTISKGIRTVRVVVHFYTQKLSEDAWTFNAHSMDEIRSTTEFMKRAAPNNLFNKSEKDIMAAVEKMGKVLDALLDLLGEKPDDSISKENFKFRILFRKAHKEYIARFNMQQKLRQNGKFVKSIASAVGRMPFARHLEVRDFDHQAARQSPSYVQQANNNEALLRRLLMPHRWEAATASHLGPTPTVELLVQLPIAIHKAGTLLHDINIELSPPDDFSRLDLSAEDCLDLKAAAQHLKRFKFRPTTKYFDRWVQRSASEFQILAQYLAALSDTPTLEDSSISLDSLWVNKTPPQWSLGPIINLCSYPNLRYVYWDGFSVNLFELEAGINHMGETLSTLTIRRMHLLSGTWAEALDILRAKFQVSGFSLVFEFPSGAECDDMDDEERDKIFGKNEYEGYYKRSLAEQYIRGRIDLNPLR